MKCSFRYSFIAGLHGFSFCRKKVILLKSFIEKKGVLWGEPLDSIAKKVYNREKVL